MGVASNKALTCGSRTPSFLERATKRHIRQGFWDLFTDRYRVGGAAEHVEVERWAGASRKLNDFWLVHHELSSEIVPAFEPDVRDPASFDSTTDMDEPL